MGERTPHTDNLTHPPTYAPLPVSAAINLTDFPGYCANTVKTSATLFTVNHRVPLTALSPAHTRPGGALQGEWVLGHSLAERSSMSAVPASPANDPIASRIARYPAIMYSTRYTQTKLYYCNEEQVLYVPSDVNYVCLLLKSRCYTDQCSDICFRQNSPPLADCWAEGGSGGSCIHTKQNMCILCKYCM